jgi:beta-glucanase (GH16 family)
LVLVAALALGALACGTSAAYGAWQLVWSDEFSQPDGSSPDPTKWGFDIGNGSGGWGNNQLEYDTSRTNNARIVGGQLVIEADQESYGGKSYTSARMLTKGKWSWAYGRMEASIKLPRGQGIWPAFWMLGTNIDSVGWPTCGETDIMENIGNTNDQAKAHGTIHGPQNGGDYNGGAGVGGTYTLPGGGALADSFHTFAVEWTTNQIKWYVDNTAYFTATPASLPSGGTWVFTQPQFLILNLAVGGNWPGYPDATTVFPQQMLVDYVRVYSYVASSIPDAPTGLSATAGGTQVVLNWSASSGATNYNVKCSTTNGGPYTTIGSTATTSYTNTGLANGTTYYYVVSAVNSFGESPDSAQISATTTVPSANLALHKVATVSSIESAGYPGANAVDGNTGTRWSSAFSDPQWIYVDLQATYSITEVKLNWESAYATSFQIQVSSNAADWTTIYSTTTGTGGIQDLTGLSGTGRYVRMYGTVRKTQYGYSLWEFEVYGNLIVPTGLTAAAGDQQVSLSWNAVPGATSYNVKCSTTNGGPYATIASPTTTGYTNSGLINGTTYYYVVSQVNAVAESTNSTQVSATPVCSAPPAPTAANNGPVCAGSTLNLTASSVQGAAYLWTGPNGFSSNVQNPSVANATSDASGVYTVRATVGSCTSLVATTTAIVNQPPSAPAAGNNGPIWAGMTLSLTASTVSGASYSWTGPNGFTSINQNPSIANATINTAGAYDVTVTVGGCTSVAGTTTVTVNPPAVISIQSSSNTLTITWPNGTLQWATNPTGLWSDVSEATSPWPITPTAPQQFFRVRLQ